MKHHLRAIENTQLANKFHSVELAVERENDDWSARVVSHLYECMSDFGASIGRPVLWWILLIAITTGLFTITEGVEAVSNPSAYVGWRADLTQPGAYGDAVRALHVTLQATFNPLSIFSGRTLIVPSSSMLAVWAGVHSALSVVLIALFIFAVRRRFKIGP